MASPCGSVTWPEICPFSDCEKAGATLHNKDTTALINLMSVRDINGLLLRFRAALWSTTPHKIVRVKLPDTQSLHEFAAAFGSEERKNAGRKGTHLRSRTG